MDWLFEWYNIIFVVPIGFAALMAVVQLAGFGGEVEHDLDHDVDSDVEHDTDHDVEHAHGAGHGHDHDAHDHQRFAELALSFFGIGRVPLSIILMTAALLFGGVGLCMNFILEPFIGAGVIYGPIAVVVAGFATVFGTGAIARLIARFMPKTESYNIRKSDLVGEIGTAILAVGARGGFLQVNDHEGNLHQVACRSENGEIPKGTAVLLVRYEEEGDRYIVRPALGDVE